MLRRLAVYFREMFPLHLHLPAAALSFYSLYLMAQATAGEAIRVGTDSLHGAATVFLAMLLPRCLDELKDEGVDPLVFPDRPLVTGRVRYSDVRLLALLSILALLPLNLGRGPATDAFLVFFVFLVLSWQWWLFPRMADNVWLVLVTHQPLVPMINAYVYAVFLETTGAPFDLGLAALLCGAYWLPVFSWEIGRKIRAPEDETNYLTYTKRWGTRRAPLVPFAAILLGGGLMAWIGTRAGLSLAFRVYHLGIAGLAAAAILVFVLFPSRRTNRVRPAVETWILLFHAGSVVEALRLGGSFA